MLNVHIIKNLRTFGEKRRKCEDATLNVKKQSAEIGDLETRLSQRTIVMAVAGAPVLAVSRLPAGGVFTRFQQYLIVNYWRIQSALVNHK